jgi:hypothetical protein
MSIAVLACSDGECKMKKLGHKKSIKPLFKKKKGLQNFANP